jgi:transcriptional regulator with PAS, ATPase and Fis domain
MHKQSGRPAGAYVTLNCANVPKDLAESELFGHEKGALTGAHAERAGVFEAADGGTLFLDEIGEMPLELQAKVLRAIEYHEVKKVGGNKVKLVTTRIVAATNRDLAAMVEAGTFREDLFYRLKVVTIALPALKDRIEDVPALADYMLDEMSEGSVVLADKAKAKLCDYEWPGNVRELHNVIAVAMYNCKHGVVDAGDIKLKPARLQERVEHGRAVYVGKTMEEIEIEVIEDAVRRHKGDKQAAAKELRIGFSTLKAKLREREIAEANARGPS